MTGFKTFRRWLLAGACGLAVLGLPVVAQADPISATIVAAIGLTGTAATIATFVITSALQIASAYALSKLSKPKNKAAAQERQASVTTLSLGEVSREAVFGRACTAGSLANAFNFGGTYGTDWECLVIALADHELDALEGYIIDGTFYAWAANGLQPGFSSCLDMEFINAKDDVPPPARFAAAAGYGSTDRLKSIAKVYFAYKASDTVFPQGRPSVKFVVRGKRCYDPRQDDTVPGGEGLHRWNDPSTWTWTENAAICRYNWVRGIYALDQVDSPEQLLIGRGLSAIEAPPDRVIAPASVCDELVNLRAGGTEKRYRVGGVIRADETYDAVEEMFAAAMAGVIVQREGGVEVEPGQAKSAVAEITDLDLVVGEKAMFDRFLPDPQRVNSVIGRYVEPAQNWSDHAAPVRRSILDIQADGQPKEEPLDLSLVTSGTQAQRCAEIERRNGRLERRATITLPPRFSYLEEGDWIGWTSERRHNGGRVVYRVEAYSRAPDWRRTLALREIAALSYSWDAATDEFIPGTAPAPEPARPAVLALSGVGFSVLALEGTDGSVTPAVKAVWATPVDPAVIGIRLEVRVAGEAEVTPTLATERSTINGGVMVTTAGVPPGTALEARLSPLADPSREVTSSAWTPVTTGASSSGGVGGLSPDEVDNRNVPIGQNAAVNSTFQAGTSAWERFIAINGISEAFTSGEGVNLVDGPLKYYGDRNVLWSNVTATDGAFSSPQFFFCWGTKGFNGALGDLQRYALPVTNGDRVGFRWLMACHRVDTPLARVRFFTKTGALIPAISGGEVDVAPLGYVDAQDGGRSGLDGAPANYYQASAIVTVPATAAFAAMCCYGFTRVGAATCYIFQMEPQLVRLTADQTLLPPYTPGPPDRNADRTSEQTAAAIAGQGALATLSQAAWATQVTGVGKPEDFATKSFVYRQVSAPSSPGLNDIWVQISGVSGLPVAVQAWNGSAWVTSSDITSLNTAAAIAGQGSLATLNQATWATHITGTGKPEDFATKSLVYRQTASPSSPGLNDIWVQLNGSGVPIAVGAWNGSSWIFGADITNLNTAAAITGQSPLATQTPPTYAGNAAALAAGLTVGMSYLDSTDSNRLKAVVASTTVGPVPKQINVTDSIPTSGSTETSIGTVGATNPAAGQIKLTTGLVGIGGGPNGHSQATLRIKATYGATTTTLYSGSIGIDSDGTVTNNGLLGANGLMVANPGSGAVTYEITRQRSGALATGGDDYQVNVLFEWINA